MRLKNQRSALFHAYNKDHKVDTALEKTADCFVLQGIDFQIKIYESERQRYLTEFKRLAKAHSEIKRMRGIPGVGEIGAVKIISTVVDSNRFPKRNNFLSYCGLVKLEKMSARKKLWQKKF